MGRTYAVVPPRSRVLVANCTRAWAWERIGVGQFPRGSIWFPGSVDRRPEVGDLFAPDPHWLPVDREADASPSMSTEPVIMATE